MMTSSITKNILMPPFSEAQVTEVEALQAIFADSEIQTIEDEAAVILTLVPDPSFPTEGCPENEVGVKVKLVLPENYPGDGTPSAEIIWKQNMNQGRLKAVEDIIQDVFDRNSGYECLFDLHTAVTEWLQNNNTPLQSILDSMNADKQRDKEQAAWRKKKQDDKEAEAASTGLKDKILVAEDCRVKEEDFERWRIAFRQEMIETGTWKDPDTTDIKPTGKQYFLNVSTKPDAAAAAAAAEQAESQETSVFWQNQDLFDAEIDEAELDDLE
eukprot:Blabericola_migrator_1__1043@NODE_1265_length_4943_cov_40_633101_g403_i1_p3_GENE_NODE_1265_length_4943_cov_40_633101_g403_i1NODE_1265_length_4943_cov_40_633101_g403_i1_p3_ORF_typecomplete_len270_score72_79RWD/PF05773_22/1_9e12RGS12_usC/PF16612_5/0_69RGS12_usC/PF16612_5/2_8e03RGS12_usC/PF16612_5/6_6e03DFRP_C/PF16543_5/3_9e02DFRP_C/PF16543_5/1_1_NODE_1265_length_4943_cov_40_633101_g403_i131743983